MSFTGSFFDESEYNASDINTVISKLVTSGIQDPFEDGIPYNITRLNGIVKNYAFPGVVPDTEGSCKCTTNPSVSKVRIAPGTAFFLDGSTITITESHEMTYDHQHTNYVFFKHDLILNCNVPACETTEPSGDIVLLAVVDKNGKVTDKRTYARGRINGVQNSSEAQCVFELTHSPSKEPSPTLDTGKRKITAVYGFFVDSFTSSKQMGPVYSFFYSVDENIFWGVNAGRATANLLDVSNISGWGFKLGLSVNSGHIIFNYTRSSMPTGDVYLKVYAL